MIETHWYRIHETHYSGGVDEHDRPIGGGPVGVRLLKLEVDKLTPKGAWIWNYYGERKFVLRDATKRYATPTIAEAWESFIARKRRQISIMHARSKKAELAIRAAHFAQIKGKESYQVSPNTSDAFTGLPNDKGFEA